MNLHKSGLREKIKPELLAPGGSLEKCQIALLYGADAVYVGGKGYSLRAFARNLNREELAAIRFLAHRLGKKVYVTVNIYPRASDLDNLPAFLEYLEEIRVDGVIVSDPGVLLLAKRWAPHVPIHLSTQANTTNALAVRFWQQHGVKRVNLARELVYDEVHEICRLNDVELELFVHGAMCVSYSGRCLLSALLNHRSANRGRCTQPCRWSYRLLEEKRPGQYFPIREDARGAYIFNSSDLCLLQELGKLMQLGINAFKIEGRMKGALYLASVTRSYRQAIDRHWEDPASFRVEEDWMQDLSRVSHRSYTKGFLFPDGDAIDPGVSANAAYLQSHTLAGIVRPAPDPSREHSPDSMTYAETESVAYIEVRSRILPGDNLEFLYPDGTTAVCTLEAFEDLLGNRLAIAHPNTWVRAHLPIRTFPLQVICVRR